MDDDLVSLYQCQKCRVRVYLRDCPGHYIRCWGGTDADYQANATKAFVRGSRDQAARPGDGYVSPHARRWGAKKGAPAEKKTGAEADEDLDVN